jgi:hypothetical protein
MTNPVLSVTQRRVVTWGIIVCALVLLAAACLALLGRATGGLLFGRSAEPRITQEMVVERVREVAKLVATEMTLRDVVTYEQTQFRSTKRTLLVVTARVSAGIDLSRGTEVRIEAAAKKIFVTVPAAQIMSVDIVNVTTYDERAGLWNPFGPEDRDVIQRRIRASLIATARQSGIIEHADRSAENALTGLLARDGYTVVITRPAPRLTPAGG